MAFLRPVVVEARARPSGSSVSTYPKLHVLSPAVLERLGEVWAVHLRAAIDELPSAQSADCSG